MAFLYERGWRQNFVAAAGFPGIEKEYEVSAVRCERAAYRPGIGEAVEASVATSEGCLSNPCGDRSSPYESGVNPFCTRRSLCESYVNPCGARPAPNESCVNPLLRRRCSTFSFRSRGGAPSS